MYIKRNLEETILSYLDSPEIIAIVGPRQCGKTSLARHLLNGLDDAVTVSFDDQAILTLFEKSPDDFIAAYVRDASYLFIDEFQYAKSGGKILKYIVDTQKIKIIISGSSAIDLTVQAVKYLVGRIIVLTLYPFDFQEFLLARDREYHVLYLKYRKVTTFTQKKHVAIPPIVHQKLMNYYQEYLLYGGYPRIVLEPHRELKKELLRNIYNTYFLREVRDILGLIDDYKLSNLMRGLALQIGSIIEYNELCQLSGYSFQALKKYLNFLEKTYVCRFIRPYFTNKRTEIVKNPKVFFFDTGLRNSIIEDFRLLDTRTDKGALLENGIAMQCTKKKYTFHYWRDKKKNEMDFVLSLADNVRVAVESKSRIGRKEIISKKAFEKAYPTIPIFVSYQTLDSKISDINGFYPIYLL